MNPSIRIVMALELGIAPGGRGGTHGSLSLPRPAVARGPAGRWQSPVQQHGEVSDGQAFQEAFHTVAAVGDTIEEARRSALIEVAQRGFRPGCRSGRIEARTGLRMMPTFPRSPLSFRTAGFPQYGWKAGLSGGAFPDATQLKSAPDIRCLSSGLHPPFVHLVVTTVVPHCVGPWTR